MWQKRPMHTVKEAQDMTKEAYTSGKRGLPIYRSP